jgi:hypothetical protein
MSLTCGFTGDSTEPYHKLPGQTMIICVRGGIDPVSPHCSMCYSAEVDLQQTDGPYAL